ncbi:hypothetical protein D3C76_805610 [compost metagenome]
MGRRSLGDGQVAYPGLNTGEAALGVDFENAIEARHHQQNAFGKWQGAARETGAGTARHHRHTALVAELQQGLHLLQTLGQHHQQRHCAVGREAVAFIGFEVFRAVQNRQVRQRLMQGLQQGGQVHGRQRPIDPLVVEDVHRLTRRQLLLLLEAYHPFSRLRVLSESLTHKPAPAHAAKRVGAGLLEAG